MNEYAFPNWMLVAVVAGLGEFAYYLYGRLGMGWPVKAAIGLAVVVAAVSLVVYLRRVIKRKKP
ncbi:MAG TPA: hypothetical protein VFV52_04485 [Bacilli bacterium]|nr:hypothetical protein [Bacilli bacterium]